MTVHKKVLLVELNEFNAKLLENGAKHFHLKNIQKMLSLCEYITTTDDTYESDFLEPWVQWVSVHTGKPSAEHGIKHLGDTPHLQTPQLWEYLGQRGITSGIWGAMNASRNACKDTLFFLPDPWTASEIAYPSELNALLDLLRYASKNYLQKSATIFLKKIKLLLSFFSSHHLIKSLLKELPSLMYHAIKYRGKHFVFISFFDYISTLLFLNYYKQYNPDFSLIFLNSLAHLQHHHWTNDNYSDQQPLAYGLKYLDKVFGTIFSALGEKDILIVTNALSQKNTNEEEPWILYRQINQSNFLKTVGITFSKVEELMTHDAHIHFSSEKECLVAKSILEHATIANQKLFLIEQYKEDPKKLFYRICFTDCIPKESTLHINNQQVRFFDLFKPIVQRTGKHIPYGTIYSNERSFPKKMKNHELFQHIARCFS
ncbi:MAG: alkaline phosphatase family protein [Chlamydiales bacterium]|nr:alkaline phosphatase family protein [Chlamydiales bacterium]